jgi:nucleotide-binding universal stress UspA family protein
MAISKLWLAINSATKMHRCYGHSRLHELLPGSTTDRVLLSAPFPILIAH